MSNERMKTLLINVLEWGYEHDNEFIDCLKHAMDITDEELKELGIEE